MSGATLECYCGRTFSQENAYGAHRRSCKQTKKRLAGVLSKAKEAFTQKKQKTGHRAPAVIVSSAQFPTEVTVCLFH
jgi:hypothetical protein